MVNVNLEIDDEKVSFTLPESWDEITIEEFVKIFSFNREGMNVLEVVIMTLCLLGNIEEEKIMMLPLPEFERLTKVLDFVNKEMEPTNTDEVEILGETYYIKKDFNAFTMGEIISIETILSQADNNLFKVMDKLLCIFLRKKKENGNLEVFKGEFLQRAETFRKAPVSKVFSVFTFFLDGGNLSSNNMNPSLAPPPKTKRATKKTGSKKSETK
jgi:hypothetical protein